MSEPTVPVPVPLIERMPHSQWCCSRNGVQQCNCFRADFAALLSQPTPTAETTGEKPHDPSCDGWMEDEGDCTCRRAEPPSIDTMAPVATHSSGEHRRVRLGEGDDLPVCDTCINILGLNVRWDHAVLRPDHDPSTIRDVSPPQEDDRG